MSKSVLGVVLTIVGVALMAIPGIGTALGLPLLTIGASSVGVAALIGIGLEIAGSLLLGPSMPNASALTQTALSRLYATLVTTEPRKWMLGQGAGGNDVRYEPL